MLGREGVTGIDRVCNLGAGKGETGGARNLWGWTLVPCVESGRKESEGGLGERGRQSFEVRMRGSSPPRPPAAAAAFRPCLHGVFGLKIKALLQFWTVLP